MKERPILFSTPLVRAILQGTKTQTRRVIDPQWPTAPTTHGYWGCGVAREGATYPTKKDRVRSDAYHVHTRFSDGRDVFIYCPFGKPGDRLWVRETWAVGDSDPDEVLRDQRRGSIVYAADLTDAELAESKRVVRSVPELAKIYRGNRWRPSIHMPRWASRVELEITDIRAERLQSISESDAQAEGVAQFGWPYVPTFMSLWDRVVGEGASWNANPWVWVVSFRRVEAERKVA